MEVSVRQLNDAVHEIIAEQIYQKVSRCSLAHSLIQPSFVVVTSLEHARVLMCFCVCVCVCVLVLKQTEKRGRV